MDTVSCGFGNISKHLYYVLKFISNPVKSSQDKNWWLDIYIRGYYWKYVYLFRIKYNTHLH